MTRALLTLALVSSVAQAENVNFEVNGKIYTKWLYRNNDSQGLVSLGNPFWPDNITGDNGVGSEFELGLLGRVGKHVEAGVRIASRFGALWQDWWENGDIKYSEENTSGESLGMNRSQYLKLRGYWVRATFPTQWLESVLIGSSDFGMWNEWTIGKSRYIDRDNGKGVFLQGSPHTEYFRYTFGLIALPKLFVGPGWTTGPGDSLLRAPFYSQDWAYGLKFESNPFEGGRITLLGTITRDSEIDTSDPDAVGSLYPDCKDELGNAVPSCQKNGAVDAFSRYSNAVVTLEAQIDTWTGGSFNALGGWSYSRVDPQLATNGVKNNEGVFPLVFDDVHGWFVRARGELFDLGGADGLTLKFEYFNIDQHFMSIFGQRREGDVLLTDGFLDGGQLPTLNLANEFIDFDDLWYESCVGWHGGTVLFEYSTTPVDVALEGTVIGYNTDGQYRDVAEVYPTFLHSDGYTDTDLYDYANVLDRGRDPRNVYRQFQKRLSAIVMLKGLWRTGAGRGLDVGWKLKFIYDKDRRDTSEGMTQDDYLGLITTGRVWLSYPFFEGFTVSLGAQVSFWKEDNRRGTPKAGYGDDSTFKAKPFLDLRYSYEGLSFHYYLEYLYKDAERERDPSRTWHVIRSKATLEVAW